MSEAHRPGPVSPRAVKRTGSCCASPRAAGDVRRRSVRQRGGGAQTHGGYVQRLPLAAEAAAQCPFTVIVRSHLVGQPCKGGHRALASRASPLTILEPVLTRVYVWSNKEKTFPPISIYILSTAATLRLLLTYTGDKPYVHARPRGHLIPACTLRAHNLHPSILL